MRIVTALVTVLIGLSTLMPGLAAATPICGCQKTGPYEDPARTTPEKAASSPNGGEFRLEVVDQTPTESTLHITNASTGALVHNFALPLPRLDWGFSPDGATFMYRHAFMDSEGASPSIDMIGVWNLKDNASAWSSSVTAGSDVAFSPHGRWFMVNDLVSQNDAQILVVDARTGATAHSEEIVFQNVPGYPGDRYGTTGMGFGPDDGDRTFVRAYRDTNGQIQLWARNLDTKTTVIATTVSPDSWWQFSPCGDVLGLVTQPDQASIAVELRKVEGGAPVGPVQWLPTADSVRLESTLASHQVIDVTPDGGEHVIDVGPNTADATCPSAAALSQLTIAPASVVGGEGNATGTVKLSGAVTAPLVVSLSSSDSTSATVPAVVTIPAGSSSATFTITSKPVVAAKAVTITATSGSVAKTASLTVNPSAAAPLESVTVDPYRVPGGQSTTGTVTLTRAAGASGSTVALSSSNPGVASVPATVTVPAGQRSVTFPIGTTAVRIDSPATITAVGGGVTRSTTVYALTTDRTCTLGTTEATSADQPLRARAFAAFDDAQVNADCDQIMTYTGGLTVGAGSTGLPVGAPVTLEFSARFDGTTMTSPPIGSGGAVAVGKSDYSVIDDTASSGPESTAEVVFYRSDFTLQHHALGVNVSKEARQYLATNVGDPQSGDSFDEATTADAVIWDVDTGTMTATFTTTVGAHLTLRSRSAAVASAYGAGATAISDFDHTFVASTQPASGFGGLALIYDGSEPLAGIGGTVTDAGGSPLAGVSVLAYGVGDTWLPSAMATTGADGSYVIGGLADGEYRIRFAGGGGVVSEWYDGSLTRAGATPVTVAGGAAVGGVDASLEVASTVSGSVTDADGSPLAGVSVMAYGATDTWLPSAVATTAADGSYVIGGLAPGTYRLLLTGPGVVSEWFEDSPTRAAASAVTVSGGGAVEVGAAVLATV